MEPEDLTNADPNMLRYFITEAQTNRSVPVRFEPLTQQDAPELQNEDWVNAVFAPAWLQLANAERVFKLTQVDALDKRIQGLVHLGILDRERGFLVNSLLEAAPFNRSNGLLQQYRGVGRVLTARLVAESVALGGQGRVIVHPRSETESFYTTIGFTKAAPKSRRYFLDAAQAELLLQSACSSLFRKEV